MGTVTSHSLIRCTLIRMVTAVNVNRRRNFRNYYSVCVCVCVCVPGVGARACEYIWVPQRVVCKSPGETIKRRDVSWTLRQSPGEIKTFAEKLSWALKESYTAFCFR